MKKIVISCIVTLAIVSIIIFCVAAFSWNTTKLSGTLVDKGFSENVEIIVKTRNIDKYLYTMKGEIIVTGNRRNHVYVFTNLVFPLLKNDTFASAIQGENIYLGSHGYLFYQKEFKNFAIITGNEKIYACDEAFYKFLEETGHLNIYSNLNSIK